MTNLTSNSAESKFKDAFSVLAKEGRITLNMMDEWLKKAGVCRNYIDENGQKYAYKSTNCISMDMKSFRKYLSHICKLQNIKITEALRNLATTKPDPAQANLDTNPNLMAEKKPSIGMVENILNPTRLRGGAKKDYDHCYNIYKDYERCHPSERHCYGERRRIYSRRDLRATSSMGSITSRRSRPRISQYRPYDTLERSPCRYCDRHRSKSSRRDRSVSHKRYENRNFSPYRGDYYPYPEVNYYRDTRRGYPSRDYRHIHRTREFYDIPRHGSTVMFGTPRSRAEIPKHDAYRKKKGHGSFIRGVYGDSSQASNFVSKTVLSGSQTTVTRHNKHYKSIPTKKLGNRARSVNKRRSHSSQVGGSKYKLTPTMSMEWKTLEQKFHGYTQNFSRNQTVLPVEICMKWISEAGIIENVILKQEFLSYFKEKTETDFPTFRDAIINWCTTASVRVKDFVRRLLNCRTFRPRASLQRISKAMSMPTAMQYAFNAYAQAGKVIDGIPFISRDDLYCWFQEAEVLNDSYLTYDDFEKIINRYNTDRIDYETFEKIIQELCSETNNDAGTVRQKLTRYILPCQ